MTIEELEKIEWELTCMGYESRVEAGEVWFSEKLDKWAGETARESAETAVENLND